MKERYDLCRAGGIFHYVRLTKKHWWSRWELEMDGRHPKIYMLHGVPAKLFFKDESFDDVKNAFDIVTKEKLTWQDIKRIVKIADDLIPCTPFASVSEQIFADEFQTEEAYYKEILKRFNETKK